MKPTIIKILTYSSIITLILSNVKYFKYVIIENLFLRMTVVSLIDFILIILILSVIYNTMLLFESLITKLRNN